MEKVYLISESTIKKNSLINNNLDGMYLQPTIELVQNIDLDTLIGPKLKEKLCTLVGSGEITLPLNSWYKKLLDEYVTDYMIWMVMSQIQLSVSFKMNNSGLTQNQDEKKQGVDMGSVRALEQQYRNYASSYGTRMKDFLDANTVHYPEYRAVKDYEMAAKRYPAAKTFLIVGYLREIDARLKGINNPSAKDADLWKELIFKIMH